MYLDVSNFTHITEVAHKKGHYGIEIVTVILRKFFDIVHRVVDSNQGEIVKFGGDSCLILICETGGSTAFLQCLKDIKTELISQFDQINDEFIEYYGIDFHVHGGLSYGMVNINIVGDKQYHLDYFIDGTPVMNAYTMCIKAGQDEIIDDLDGEIPSLPDPERESQLPESKADLTDEALFLPPQVKQKLLKGSRPAELRNVAVIFVHLEPETEGPLDIHTYQGIYARIQHCVYGFDGIINKIDYTEKGYLILICFGIPFIHTDDIERAFLCAIQIAKLNSPSLRIQLGINYSNIYAGIIGAENRHEYGILGNAVNIAARLMSFAGGGEVALSSEIVHRVNSRFEIEPLSVIQVKGIKEPITINIVRRELPERWLFYRNSFADLPLVVEPERIAKLLQRLNREEKVADSGLVSGSLRENDPAMDNPAECTSIRDRVDELILITGAEGCGKSFLVWQLCHPLFDRKGEIELLYADALSANLQFDVLHKILLRKLDIIDLRSQFAILEDWCRQNGEDHTIAGIQPFLYPALDVKHAPPREYSPQEIEVIYDKLAQIAQRLLSGVQCVVIENYEYFDDNSRTLLKRLIRLCIAAGQRVILTAVQDPNFTADAVDHIALDKLTPEQSDALIRQLIPNISSLAVNLLHQISDGNPRFLVELIRQIRNCYDVQNDLITDHIINEMRNNGMIPDSLENLMLAHYEQLGDMEKQLLKQTAIFGRPFIYDEMRDLFGDLWETHYQEMVLELQRQGLFSTIGFLPTPVFAYVNTIFPESIYRTILLSEKKKLHLVIADYFEKKHSENETKHVAFIAYHYICAGDRKKMIPWCKEAANLYLRLGAYEQCRFFLHKIIENSPYENETCAAALLIADSHLRQANNADAETILTRYKYLKDLVGESHDRFISLYVRWLNNTADFAGIRDFVLQYLSTVADNEIRSQVHIDYIEALVFNNAVDEVESEALPLYRTLSAKHKTAALNKLSGVLAQFYVNQGEYKQALDYYHQKLKYAEKLDDAFSQRIANAGIGIVYARQGRKTLAYRYYQKAIEIAERIGDRNGYAKALMDLGTLHRNAAEHTKALDCYLKCLSIAQHIGNRILESIVTYNIGELHNFLRDFVNARDYVQRSLSISQKIADHTGVSFCYDALGDICFEEHKLDEAEEIYRKNLELQTRIQDHEGIAHTIGNLGNIAKHRDDIDKARELYRKQLELVSEIGDIESMGKARFNLAMLHIDQNNPVAALEDLEQALILFKQCESAYLTELSEEQIQAVREMLR